MFCEFEFNSIGRRLFGDGFKAGHGHQQKAEPTPAAPMPVPKRTATTAEFDFGDQGTVVLSRLRCQSRWPG